MGPSLRGGQEINNCGSGADVEWAALNVFTRRLLNWCWVTASVLLGKNASECFPLRARTRAHTHGLQVWPLKTCCTCKSLSSQNNRAINQKVEWNNFTAVIEQVWLGLAVIETKEERERERERDRGGGGGWRWRSQANFFTDTWGLTFFFLSCISQSKKMLHWSAG